MGHDREKPSWSEIDKRRGQPRSSQPGHPRGRDAQQRAEREKRSALREADALFSGERGGEAGAALARAVREAHGSPQLGDACRDYVAQQGVPDSTELLSIFLDCGEVDVMVPALERLLAQKEKGRVQMKGGLELQLRMLADHRDDDVAGLSEDLLA